MEVGEARPGMVATDGDGFAAWIVQETHWSRAGLAMAAILLAQAPALRRGLDRVSFLVYLQLPIYMIHQYEEHAHGAFEEDINRMLLRPRGRRVTDARVFWINILGVWGMDTVALYLARFARPALGLIAPYLAVVNGLTHVAAALKQRRYNPGLWTSLLLFLPFGGGAIRGIARACSATRGDHARGLATSVLLHVLVMIDILRSPRVDPSAEH